MSRNTEALVISNANRPLGDVLNDELRNADQFLAASAFLNSSGLNVILAQIERVLSNEGCVSIVHGADFRVTDPDAVRTLVDMRLRYGNMSYLVYFDWSLTHRQRFHPKLYLTTSDYERYCAIVGSSNLTLGGLRRNTEVNVVIRGSRREMVISDCMDIYQSIRNDASLVEPDIEFVEKYAELHGRARDFPVSDVPPSELEELYRAIDALRLGPQSRAPRTQVEYVVRALMNLTGGHQKYIHLNRIYTEAERLARDAGQRYDWDTFRNSVRGRINENVVGRPSGKELFERRGIRSGEYRLSEQGRTYASRLLN